MMHCKTSNCVIKNHNNKIPIKNCLITFRFTRYRKHSLILVWFLFQMSKRSYPHYGGPSQFMGPSKKRRKGKTLSVQDVLDNATCEERLIFNQKQAMQAKLKEELLPEYAKDDATQKEISTARMMDEIYQTPWKRTVTIGKLQSNPKDFAKIVMSLEIKIVPNEEYYRYVTKENWEQARYNNQVRRQFRQLTVRRYEYLAEGNPMSAFNCYSVPFQLWKDFMKNNGQEISAREYKSMININECRKFLEKAKEELVTNEVFCALSSLKGTVNKPETTPQDKMLYERLKNKMTSNDLRTKIPRQDSAAKDVVRKPLRENLSEERHSYLPVTEKAVRYICEKLNLTVDQLLDSDAKFTFGPKLTPEEEKIIEEERRMICGWSRRPIAIEDEPATADHAEIVPKSTPKPETVLSIEVANN